jgi:hypothetical protein
MLLPLLLLALLAVINVVVLNSGDGFDGFDDEDETGVKAEDCTTLLLLVLPTADVHRAISAVSTKHPLLRILLLDRLVNNPKHKTPPLNMARRE